MELGILVALISAVIAILTFGYLVTVGSKSLPEWWRDRRRIESPPPKQLTRRSADEDNSNRLQPESGNIAEEIVADVSEILFKATERLTTVSCNDGERIAFGGFSKRLYVLFWNSKRLKEMLDHKGVVRNVIFHPSQNVIASAGDDGFVYLTSPSNREFQVIGQHDGPVYCVAFHPKEKTLVSVGKDAMVKFWAIENAPIQRIGTQPKYAMRPIDKYRNKEGSVFAVDFDPSGTSIATAGVKGAIHLIDTRTRKSRKLNGSKDTAFCVRFDPTGKFVAAGSADGTLRIWNLETDQREEFRGHEDTARWLSFHRSGRLLVSGSKDRSLRLWDLTTKRCWILEGHTDYVYSVEFAPGGTHILSCSGDGTVRVWPLPSAALALLEQDA
jgi:WD40 repeat protein